jgi:hypothetical protein
LKIGRKKRGRRKERKKKSIDSITFAGERKKKLIIAKFSYSGKLLIFSIK